MEDISATDLEGTVNQGFVQIKNQALFALKFRCLGRQQKPLRLLLGSKDRRCFS